MPKVMIVDDDRTTVTLLKMLLEMDGFDVTVAARGALAVDQALQEKPNVFLIDYHLADMDGTALIKRLRAEPQFARTPIVVGSGEYVEDEVKRAGANVFLIKPYEPGKLAGLFTKLLE